MMSNIAKKRYPQTHKHTDFLKYCSPSAAALGEGNDFIVESILAIGVIVNLMINIYLGLKHKTMMKRIKNLTEMSKAPKIN